MDKGGEANAAEVDYWDVCLQLLVGSNLFVYIVEPAAKVTPERFP